MHPVGDRADPRAARHRGKQFATHLAVQRRHTVGARRPAEAERRHVEHRETGIGVAAESEHLIDRHSPALGPMLNVRFDQIAIEPVDTGRHRGVRGEQHPRSDPFERLSDRRRPSGDLTVDQLQEQEAGMTFVEMVDPRRPAERLNRAGTADAEHEFLLETVQPVAAVETIGDRAIRVGVRLEVAVESEESDRANREPPHSGRHDTTRHRHLHHHTGIDGTEALRVMSFEPLTLGAVDDFLAEEAVAIEEADAGEAETEIARRLEMVAGEDAETTGVLRQGLGDAELGGEVGDLGSRRTHDPRPKRGDRLGEVGRVGLIVGEGSELVVGEALNGDRWMHTGARGRDAIEHRTSPVIPGPVQVGCEFFEVLTDLLGVHDAPGGGTNDASCRRMIR